MKKPFPVHVLQRTVLVLIFSFVALSGFGATTNKYAVTEFPNPPGHSNLRPTDINNKGEIVFFAQAIGEPGPSPRMFIYLPSPAYGLPAGLSKVELPNRSLAPASINDHGQVAGFTAPQLGKGQGFLWENGVFQQFNFAASDDSTYVHSINNAGYLAGTYEVLRPDSSQIRITRGFIRTTNDVIITNPINVASNDTYAVAINNSNIVAGSYRMNNGLGFPSFDQRGFFWDDGLTPLGPYPLDEEIDLEAYDLNDSGEIVGVGTFQGIFTSRPYLWLPAAKYGLPAGLNGIMPEAGPLSSICINNSGQVATPQYFWDRGTTNAMSDLLPASVEEGIGEVVAMNNHGQIIGFLSHENQSNFRAVLLTPGTNDALIVNVTGDAEDADPGDGIIDVDLDTPEAQVSLRAAINHANSTNRPGPDTIEFDIAEADPVILPTNALPDINESLTINGSSQSGGFVTLRGNLAGAVDGLRLRTTASIIKGMVIQKFQGAGIDIEGGSDHRVSGNIIGTDAGGGPGFGNGTGVRVSNSTSNFIGGLTASLRNIISGNTAAGIALSNCTAVEIRANLVGTDPTGASSLPNGQFGLIAEKIKNLSIGVASAISVYNSPTAIKLRDVSGSGGGGNNGGKLVNSYVGLNLGGTVGLAATANGLIIEDSSDFEIGGSQKNVFANIASNAIAVLNSSNVNVTANYIGTSSSGNVSLPVGIGIFAQGIKKLAIGLTNALTVINGQNAVILRDNGIVSATRTNASMVNCNIGLNASGNAALGGTETGLRLEGVSGVDIGGAARNVFAGISSNAITVLNATNINILANHIGTARSGNTSIPVGIGIAARNARDLVIGMSNQLTVINGQTAVLLDGVTGSGADGVGSIMNNCFVGLNAVGNSVLAAMTNGVRIENSTGFKLGGIVRNVFGGITSNAVTVLNSTNIGLLANYIGTSSSGNVNLPVGAGIIVENAHNLVIGSTNQLSVINARTAAILKRVTGSGIGGVGSKMNNCYVGLSASGTTALTTTNGVQVENSTGFSFGDIARNILGGIRSNAITILDSTNIQVAANYIGTSASGNTSLPGGIGILAERARNLTIGSTTNLSILNARTAAILRNVLASGGANGMDNCYVGLNANGIASLGAVTTGGIQMENCAEFNLGGVARNIMSGISNSAMTILNSTNIRVLSGYFGTDANGTNRVANPGNNITVVSSPGFSVGRNIGGAASVLLSGANRHAIEATDSPNLNIAFTTFGTDALGVKAISNLLSAIKVTCTAGFAANAVAGTTIIKSNLIAFSGNSGIEFTQDPVVTLMAAVHRIEANLIRQNKGHGILLGTNVSSVTIGGTNLSGANEIIRNGGSGVNMTNAAYRNLVQLNAIYTNLFKAIEAKHQMQMQIITAMRGSTHVQGNVSGPPNQTLLLHFYGHRPKVGSQGEGEMWVGSINVPLNASGEGSYNSRLPRTTPSGWLVAATAADPILGTSEFSNSQTVQPSTDTDGDGLPDFWEALYPSCLDPLVPDPPNEDCDLDGFTNLQEYTAGTDPTQPNSALRLLNLTIDGNGASVEFLGIAGRQYGLERQISLGNGLWQRVATAVPEVDGEVTLIDPNPPSSGNAFYRLVAEFP